MSKVLPFRNDIPTWEEALEDFLNLKGAEGRAKRTLYDYRKHVTRFFTLFPLAYENERKARSCLLKHLAESKTPSTHNLRLEYLRGYFRWLWEEGIFTSDVTFKLKKQRNSGKFVSVDEEVLQQLLLIPDRSSYAGYRDYALILFTLDTATRPGEALQLTPNDFNFISLEVRIPSEVAKTRVSRTLPLSPNTAYVLRKLWKIRHSNWDDRVPMFASYEGKLFLETSWAKRLRSYCKELGVKVTPYQLRHSAATLFLRNGGNALALQKMMGHSTMEMTGRYVHLVEGDIRAQDSQFSPVTKLMPQVKRVKKLRK